MDREESIKLLRGGPSGVERWNRFRKSGDTVTDLSKANLSRCDLINVNLRGVCLSAAFFGGSNLDRADLREADLHDADFQAGRLYKAKLQHANLRGANLRSANVEGADLSDADLRDATLLSINVSGAVLRVADPAEIEASMDRIDKLPVHEDSKASLKAILQELEFHDDLPDSTKNEVASYVDELAKVLLTSPVDSNRVTQLLDVMSTIASPVVADISEGAFPALR